MKNTNNKGKHQKPGAKPERHAPDPVVVKLDVPAAEEKVTIPLSKLIELVTDASVNGTILAIVKRVVENANSTTFTLNTCLPEVLGVDRKEGER